MLSCAPARAIMYLSICAKYSAPHTTPVVGVRTVVGRVCDTVLSAVSVLVGGLLRT